MKETALLKVSGTTARSKHIGDVVFVHGLNGDLRETWSNGSKQGFWPDWLAEDCPDLDVWSLGYQVSVIGGPGAAMPLLDRANNVLAILKNRGIGSRPLCFITHSMGGLLVKQMLRNAHDLHGGEFKSFTEFTRGVVFLATPHTGSDLAKLMQYLGFFLRPTHAARELEAHAASLRELNYWYREHVRPLHIKTQVYFESAPTRGVYVVDPVSADPGIEGVVPFGIDADHISICKFSSKDTLVYERTKQFVLDLLSHKDDRLEGRLKDPFASVGEMGNYEQVLAFTASQSWEGREPIPGYLGSQRPTRPESYIPVPRDPLFQPRHDEFTYLERLLFVPDTDQKPVRLGLIGMGGVGKTQLAIQLAYRYEKRFPAGVFWMPTTGENIFEWQHALAELADASGYLPPGDHVSHPENEVRRARHLCRYLAHHEDALLILDNVVDPHLTASVLPSLAGRELACAILYTSRSKSIPRGATVYSVQQLPEEGAFRLLLDATRPSLLSEVLSGSQNGEACAARAVCKNVEYLPLALVHLRGLLVRDPDLTLVRLAGVLQERGALELTQRQYGDAAPLFATFQLSWERVGDEAARKLFKLATYFPEAAPIPLWLLGLAAGLGESEDIWKPLGGARAQLQEWSLVETLSRGQMRLHPLIRQFGQRLVKNDGQGGFALLKEAAMRLEAEFTDLNKMEKRTRREGFWKYLERVRAAREYAELLGAGQSSQIRQVERWLNHESYLLGYGGLWPETIPGLFYQQLYNRSIEEDHALAGLEVPNRWLRQIGKVGAEDTSVLQIFEHPDGVMCAAFSADGFKVVTGSDDGTVRVWEVVSGKVQVLKGSARYAKSVVFSSDGSQVLVGYGNGVAQVWDVASGQALSTVRPSTGTDGKRRAKPSVPVLAPLRSVAFSPDGGKVAIASLDGTVQVWDIAGRALQRKLPVHTRMASAVAFSLDGSRVVTSSNGMAQVWEVVSGQVVAELKGRADQITSVAFSPDSSKVVLGADRGVAQIWEVTSGQVGELRGHTHGYRVTSVAFSPDGSRVLTGSDDGSICVWEVASKKVLRKLCGHARQVTSVGFSSDGSKIVTTSVDRTARVWEVENGSAQATVGSDGDEVISVVFSPDGSKAITGSMDETAAVWEVASGKELARFADWGMAVALSPDGSMAVTAPAVKTVYDNTAQVRRMASGKVIATLQGFTGRKNSVAFSPDGKKVVAGSYEKVVIWRIASGQVLASLYVIDDAVANAASVGRKRVVTCAAFSPDGISLATGYSDGMIRLWEVASGQVLATLEGHMDRVDDVEFSPDGSRLVTASSDGPARLWEAASGEALVALRGHTSAVLSAGFSPDNHLITTGDMNGHIFLWQASGSERGRLLGAYVATYQIEAVHWLNTRTVLLADGGGPQFRPHFYRLVLEGEW